MADKKNILYLLDMDPFPSPFDINVAYDAGYDVVVPLGGVTTDNVKQLIEDAMFSRGVGGATHTKIFLNGSDQIKINECLKIARKSMVPPFELATFIDPRGGYTTGASIVAKVEDALSLIGKQGFNECKTIVYGGTGMVGQVCAVISAKMGAKTILCSRRKEKAERICNELKEAYGVDLIPMANGEDPEKIENCKDADVIYTCGTAGVQMISANVLEHLPKGKILADANAVPPLGVEGIKPTWDGKEHKTIPGFYVFGALSVGDVKLKTEKKALQQLMEAEGQKVFDFFEFYERAKKVIAKKKAKNA